MTDVVQTNGHDWWADHSDNGATWWTGTTVAADTAAPTQPPPPPPPPPAPVAEPTAVVPPVSPAPPAHPTPPAAIRVAPAADPDGDGWAASPPAPVTGAAVAVAPVAVEAAPKTSWLEAVRARFGGKPKRYRWAMPLVVLIVALVAFVSFTKILGRSIASGVSSTMTAHDQTIVSAVAAVANPAPQQVTVTNVLSWLPCPLTADAKGMIGYDPPGGPGLNGQRASAVDLQARKWLLTNNPRELRISQPDATHLVVFVNPITEGVPLIDCTEQQLPTATTAATAGGR